MQYCVGYVFVEHPVYYFNWAIWHSVYTQHVNKQPLNYVFTTTCVYKSWRENILGEQFSHKCSPVYTIWLISVPYEIVGTPRAPLFSTLVTQVVYDRSNSIGSVN